MASSLVYFSDLKSGRCSSTVDARLLRFWEARNVKRGGELMWIDMLMVDSKATIMQASIPSTRIATYRGRLSAGKMYTISGFDVARCAKDYKLSESSLLIRFNNSTTCDEITEAVSALPEECFRFRNHTELLGLANTNSQLPDLIGEITGVRSTVSDPPQEKNHVTATVKLDTDVTVTLSLFDSQAVSFHKKLESMRGDPRVIVATCINPKLAGGRVFLNATSGTHVFFDKETHAGETFFYRLAARDAGISSVAPLLRGYTKVEPLSIAELNNFVLSAPSQEIDFICNGRVTRVDMDKGWCYVSCSKCGKKLHRTTSAFTCARCENTNDVGVLRYRVEMGIADDTAEGVFVFFDGVMTRLHRLRASDAGQMLAEEGVNPEDTRVPPFIADMEGKTYTFQVRVNTYNFTASHQTFTITRILDERDRAPQPDFDNHGGNNDGGDDMPGAKPIPVELQKEGSSGSGGGDGGTGKGVAASKRKGGTLSGVTKEARVA